MNLTDDVYEDLLTVYLAGDASAGTKALVEARAREDSAFAARLAAAKTLELPANGNALRSDGELASLKRTKRFITLRTIFLADAILFTLLPFVFAFDQGSMRFLILGHHNPLAWAFWSLAAASWVACWVMHRAVGRAGL